MAKENMTHCCPEIELDPTPEECQPGMSGIRIGIMYRFLGKRKNLRGVKRSVGDVWQLPKGFVCYTPSGWVQMRMPETIQTEAVMTEPKPE